MFKIAELEIDEIPKVAHLMKKLCSYRNQVFDTKRFEEGIKRRLKNDHDRIFIVKKLEEDRIIAMLIADFDKNIYEGYIKSVIVEDEYRGLGMGENLIQAALEYFQDQNAVNIKINIDEAETRAFHLYSKVGFKPELLPEEEKVKIMKIKMDYIHNNPLRAGLTKEPKDYLYSSFRNYYLNDQSVFRVDCVDMLNLKEI